MQRAKFWVRLGLGLIATSVLAGCHGRSQPSPSYPSNVTPQQMDQALAQINNDPHLTPQQKVEASNALRGHLHVHPSDSQPKRQ
jgi:cytochrome c-type biogenesis protein CcmH/NrfG